VSTTKKPAAAEGVGNHKKVTFTIPPDAVRAVDEHWRFHETLDAGLADSKSEYVADLIRRDAVQKTHKGGARRP
jgi:hypothetical protein